MGEALRVIVDISCVGVSSVVYDVKTAKGLEIVIEVIMVVAVVVITIGTIAHCSLINCRRRRRRHG